ncbi:SGNH hydrolase-type esterase domain-containing protein [Xylariales sp. PMI_506]|nr:SGNH hydrolase-type esterase domain-containing protein [Xylariales sp. PMI_506]
MPIWKMLRSTRAISYINMIVARRRFLIALGAPLVILMMLMSGMVVDVDISLQNQSTLNGVHVAHVPSNSSLAHSNYTLTERPKITYHPYQRPGYELPLAKGIPLRILAIGASTTRGDSPVEVDNNGFRRPLREKLTALGHKVNFVGTSRLGNMTDNDITAGPGVRVGTIHDMAKEITPRSKPNIVLINAGTNDCLGHFEIDNFYKRYDDLVQFLLMASHKTTLVMSTLLPTWNDYFKGRDEVFRVNPQIRMLAKIYQKQGLPVVLAEMQGKDGIQDENLTHDGMHPAEAGYEMMATKLFMAIVEADARGFLQPPEYVPGIPDDGEDGRKDEPNYLKWAEQQHRLSSETKEREESIMARMEAELEMRRQQRKAA